MVRAIMKKSHNSNGFVFSDVRYGAENSLLYMSGREEEDLFCVASFLSIPYSLKRRYTPRTLMYLLRA